MKKEFTFIKGVYTKSPLFNDDIKKSLLILDRLGNPIGFEAIDDKENQDKLIYASKDNVCELYTITSNQITVEGHLTTSSTYNFTACAKNKCESGKEIPGEALLKANELLETGLQADLKNLSNSKITVGEDSNPTDVSVDFTYNTKTFTKQMKFRVEGSVDVKTLENLEKLTFGQIYGDVYSYESVSNTHAQHTNNINYTLFRNGRKQKIGYNTMNFPISTYELSVQNNRVQNSIIVANNYKLPNNYTFKIGDDFVSTASYTQLAVNSNENQVDVYNSETIIITSFTLPSIDENTLLDDSISDAMYIKNENKNEYYNIEKGVYYGTSMVVYNIEDLTNDDDDDKIYKKVTNDELQLVNNNLVKVLDNNIIAPVLRSNQIVTINPDKVSITARES